MRLFGLVGITSDRDSSPAAGVCGSARVPVGGDLRHAGGDPERDERHVQQADVLRGAGCPRQQLAATIDCDGDGVPEEAMLSGVHTLKRA